MELYKVIEKYYKNSFTLVKETYQNGAVFFVLRGTPKQKGKMYEIADYGVDIGLSYIVEVWDTNDSGKVLTQINTACKKVWKNPELIQDFEEEKVDFDCLDCKWRVTFQYPPQFFPEWRCGNGNNDVNYNSHKPEQVGIGYEVCNVKEQGDQYCDGSESDW